MMEPCDEEFATENRAIASACKRIGDNHFAFIHTVYVDFVNSV